jgi:hypothetical protein
MFLKYRIIGIGVKREIRNNTCHDGKGHDNRLWEEKQNKTVTRWVNHVGHQHHFRRMAEDVQYQWTSSKCQHLQVGIINHNTNLNQEQFSAFE